MRIRTARIFFAFAAIQLAAPISIPMSAVYAQDQGELDAFHSSSYSYCDAEVLGKHWGESTTDAKATIGRKIGWGNEDIINSELTSARDAGVESGATSCYYFASDAFGYDAAEAVAQAWSISIDEAKANIGYKLANGMESNLHDIIGQGRDTGCADGSDGEGPETGVGQNDMSAYAGSGFTYCDAEVLAASWQVEVTDAKNAIGAKINAGHPELAKSAVKDARDAGVESGATSCYYFASDSFGYDDAEALSQAWGIDIDQAKAAIGYKIATGMEAAVRSAIGQ